MNRQPACSTWFDTLLSLPLAVYLIIILALMLGVFGSITTKALRIAWKDPSLGYAINLSLSTSLTSTILSVLVAVPVGYVMSRRRFPGHIVADTMLDMPIVLPPLVMGLSVLIFFSTDVGMLIDRGIWRGEHVSDPEGLWADGIFIYRPLGIVLVQFIIGCAFAVRVIKAGFDALDPRFEETAMTLGANRMQTFFKVTLPNVSDSLIAAAVISWARIFGLFGPVLLVAGTMRRRTEIMPTTIFLETSIGRIEVALVVGALMIFISVVALVLLKKLGGKGYLW